MVVTAGQRIVRAASATAAAATLLTLCGTGCGDNRADHAPAPPAPALPVAGQATPAPPPPPPPPPPSPESVHANELGQVPVLMYHRITTAPESVYDRTPTDFRAELERLAGEGYVPVTATDYATGHIDVPAGRHPVVLTFDDGSVTQFTVDGSGRPADGTAVRILLDVAAAHPDFRPVATFYVNNPPFEEPTGKVSLNWLHDHGFEIGNHTLDHANLRQATAAEATRQIAGMQRVITDAVPGVPVRTLALPFGAYPRDRNLVVDGSSDGVTYHLDGVLLVGANPAPSPWSDAFDSSAIPRIRSQAPVGEDANFGSTVWLDKLAANPELRYTSDGDPQRISAPAQSLQSPAPAVAERLYRY